MPIDAEPLDVPRFAPAKGSLMSRTQLVRYRAIASALCIIALLSACSDSPAIEATPKPKPRATAGVARPTAAPRPTARPQTGVRPQTNPDQQTWLVMLYFDADDETLEEDMLTDLNEAEIAGSTNRVTIVAQVDRYDGGYSGQGDWTSTKRFLVTKDDNLRKLHSTELADIGELNMADGDTLVDFVSWAAATYPADHHALIMSDHGAGWPGGWNDPSSEVDLANQVPLAASMGDMLFLNELHDALATIQAKTSIGKLDVIGFDACLMSTIEVYTAIAPYADYAVASAEVEPTLGWAYAALLSFLDDHPESDGAALADAIVSSYIQQDELIVDDAARSRYVKSNYDADSMTAAEVIKAETERTTLAAVDLAAVPALNASLNRLVRALALVPQTQIAASRRYALAFESVFDENQPKPAIDLGSFAQLLRKNVNDPAVDAAADDLQAALDRTVIDSAFGRKLKTISGISIHFPNSKLYKDADAGAASYAQVAKTFVDSSLWDDFLAFHYTKRRLPAADIAATPPPANAPATPVAAPVAAPDAAAVAAPDATPIKVAHVTRSAASVTRKKPVTIGTTITGANIAFIYVFVGRADPKSGTMQLLDMDFLLADTTRVVGGVEYPDWSGGGAPIDIEYDWDGTLTAIDSGGAQEIALIQPERYGGANEDASYTIEGSFITAKGKKPRRAMLRFSAGELVDAYGFSGSDGSGAMRAITPKPGDRFTVSETSYALDRNAAAPVTTQGATVVFGADKLTWDMIPAPKGAYLVGFIAEDFDGNWYTAATDVAVR